MVEAFKKTPLPIMDPTTIVIASNGPKTRGKTCTLLGSGVRMGCDMAIPF
jgi:hypothetical protein